MTARRLHVSVMLAGALAVPLPAGAADADADPAWQWSLDGKLDAVHAVRPAIDTAAGQLLLTGTVDGARVLGWPGSTLHGELLSDQGGKPARTLGSVQGVSNIEVAHNAARLYAAWIEQQLAPGASALVGLFDLNAEFYATDSAGLLVNPAFGIGTEFGQSGRNGPSIFPQLSLGVRAKLHDAAGWYLQAAALDGVPGDPDHPGRSTVRLRGGDGVLWVAEGGWRGAGPAKPPLERDARSVGLGLWDYSVAAPRLDGRGVARNQGLYVLAQMPWTVIARTATGFVRAGLANGAANPVDAALQTGLLIDFPFGTAGPTALSVGIAHSHLSQTYRTQQASAGPPLGPHETTIEVTGRWQLTTAWSLQPWLQRLRTPGGQAGGATLVGLRLAWSVGTEGR